MTSCRSGDSMAGWIELSFRFSIDGTQPDHDQLPITPAGTDAVNFNQGSVAAHQAVAVKTCWMDHGLLFPRSQARQGLRSWSGTAVA